MSIDDLDLEKVERILQGEESRKNQMSIKTSNLPDKRLKRRSKTRSKSRSSGSSPDSEEKRKPRSRSRSRSSSKGKRRGHRHEVPKTEGKRGGLTILVMNLSMETLERDIFSFLTKKKVGKIRDIKIIRDSKSKRSKGVAYIEFYDKEAVDNAIALSGSVICGNEIRIQHSQAEKNRSGASLKPSNKFPKSSNQARSESPESQGQGTKRIYVGGLTDHLAELKEQDIKELFSSVGEVDSVVIHRDMITGKGKGYAFVQFKCAEDAKEAVEKMDGMLIANKTLKVSSVQSNMAGTINSFNNYANSESLDLDDESGHNFLHNSQSRALLMQKLTRANNGGGLAGSKMKMDEISQTPTNSLLFVNMYTQEDLTNEKNFLSELKTRLKEECTKFGEVRHLFLDPEVEGNIWVKFKETQASVNTQRNLNDRYFAGRKMTLYFVKEEFFKKKFAV